MADVLVAGRCLYQLDEETDRGWWLLQLFYADGDRQTLSAGDAIEVDVEQVLRGHAIRVGADPDGWTSDDVDDAWTWRPAGAERNVALDVSAFPRPSTRRPR
jgi:hypothetical protein